MVEVWIVDRRIGDRNSMYVVVAAVAAGDRLTQKQLLRLSL